MMITVSGLSAILVAARYILMDISKDWSNGKVNEKLFEIFNVSSPCGKNCPVKYMVPQNCFHNPKKQIISILIDAPIIDPYEKILLADPFKMYSLQGGSLCSVTYNGPNAVIHNTQIESTCLFYVSEYITSELVLKPDPETCWEGTQANIEELWTMGTCKIKKFVESDVVQVTLDQNTGITMIYCFPFIITFEIDKNSTLACPNYVFSLKGNTSFAIGRLRFTANMLSTKRNDALIPGNADMNAKLFPKIMTSRIVANLELIRSRVMQGRIPTDKPVDTSTCSFALLIAILSLILCIIFFAVLLLSYKKRYRAPNLPFSVIEI